MKRGVTYSMCDSRIGQHFCAVDLKEKKPFRLPSFGKRDPVPNTTFQDIWPKLYSFGEFNFPKERGGSGVVSSVGTTCVALKLTSETEEYS